ncbi:hypothetical protein ACRJ4W_23060 [Streptomyces sp. GLT-R25]
MSRGDALGEQSADEVVAWCVFLELHQAHDVVEELPPGGRPLVLRGIEAGERGSVPLKERVLLVRHPEQQ